ncbi:Replicase polyprotein 1a [Frankliniella fusca]|uniref:Replicase polyprotein 1a n=1 Tax=Frankliniella fusca TaxID=407009 RepID=A0AAE1H1N4_9NEOP|nr:Replicase polyprotein 1a [Frankliniella fusca]
MTNGKKKSQATNYRIREKIRNKNKFKHYCTCSCIIHKQSKDKGGDNIQEPCSSKCNKEPSTSQPSEELGGTGGNSERSSFSNHESDHSAEDSEFDDIFDSELQVAFLGEDQDGNASEASEADEQMDVDFNEEEGGDTDDGFEPPEDPDDADDPDDPDFPDVNDEENQDDGNEDDRANFGLNNPHLTP